GNFGSALLVQQNQANAKGSAGNLKINTHQLLLADGAFIGTGTLGIANGGFLTINADSVDIINGINPNKTTGISSQAEEGSRGNAGNLTINTHDLRIKDGAFVTSSTKSVGNAGNLTINATGSVQLIGTNPNGTISTLLAQSQDKATGAPGNLTINTNQLLVQDGAFVGAGISSLSPTKSKSAGNLTINASDFVHVIGTSPNGSNSSGLSTQAEAGATGASGNLTINTHELLVRDGAFVSASTKGSGNGGNLNIKADSVQVIGTFAKGKGSSLLVQAEPGSSGNAGDLTINTGELLVQGGAFVGTGTFGKGNGGNLTVSGNLTAKADSVKIIGTFADTNSSGLSTQAEQGSLGNAGNLIINTRELLVQGGGFVSSGTKSSGNGGDLNIKADSVKIIGTSPNRTTTSSILTEAQAGSSGNAGNLIIDTRDLVVRGNPTIKTTESRGVVGILVRSLGTGNAGNLTINARSILLDSNAALTGDTNKEKATITLHSRDYLILTRGGSITTDARGSNVIGGNTNINTDTLAAVNSVISASSRDSRGGQVTINAQSIFRSNDTEITATGASPQLNGTVQINTLNIDPSRGLVILPTISEVTPKLISSRCQAFNEAQGGSQFILTGRGGLPTSPYEPLTSDAIWTDSRIPATTIRQYLPKKVRVRPIIKRKPITINPATGWVFNGNGEVTLISSTRNVTGSASTPASCPRP
ncbi:beta strand repeat-containing protein, partial [Aetokthonos hydrillicola]